MDIELHKQGFREALLTWFEGEKEDFPWRRTTDPWSILVSEVMLQQTQVATVLGKGFYDSFLRRFPDVQSISKASEQEILKAWEGLGYYRRVRNLQKTAQAVVTEHGGVFPQDHTALLALPGVGPYTAGAVCSFAFHSAQALVDANVARVFSRLFNYHELVDSGKGIKQLWQWAGDLLDRDQPASYNSALMELGQKVCKNKNPQCMLCPVRQYCTTEVAEILPKKKLKRPTELVTEVCVWRMKGRKVLMRQETPEARREGMWVLPKILSAPASEPMYQANYAITHHKVSLSIYQEEVVGYRKQQQDHWVAVEELEDYPMPSPYRKAVNALLRMNEV